jgi:HPt (histidine-containing phosphotransfer) domain-containing protein
MPSTDSPRAACPVLDYDEAVRRLDGQAELFGMVASIFLEDCPKTLDAIRTALSAGDLRALAFSAHKLKGALSTLSAHPAQDTAARLELSGIQGDLKAARRLHAVLEEQVQVLIPALNELIPTLLGSQR